MAETPKSDANVLKMPESSISAGRTCAYCGQASDLTNEHVIPECFQKTFEPITTAKTPTGEKAVTSALLIGDVCPHCNNGPLSQLDTYLCELNDRYFRKVVRAGDCVRFEFNFDLLLRVLLKIGFHYCPAITRTESTGWRNRVNPIGSPRSEVPVKLAFSRKA